MTGLPAPLGAWGPDLAVAPLDLAIAIRPWLGPLDRFLAPMFAPGRASSGEPDGYGDLGRRGPLSRLLESQWALWALEPDEMVRRFADRQLLYRQWQYRDSRARRELTLLFDAGPAQLGLPRLGQLAILIVLARRMREGGGRLRWGIVQDREHTLDCGVGAAGLRRFVAARSFLAPEAAAVRSWEARLLRVADPGSSSEDGIWWVGARTSFARLAPRTRCIEFEEREAPATRMLDVALVRTGRRTPILALACPTPEQQQRAFNVPDENIADRRITPGFFPDDAPIRMSASGHRALVVLPRGEVAGFAPNRPPRRFRPRAGETVVATGWHKSYLLAVTRDKTLFRLWLAPRGAGGMPANQIAVLDVPVLLEHLPSVGQVWANHDRTKWLVAGEGWGWIADRQAGQVTSIEGQVLGHGASNRAYVFIVLDPDGTVRMRGSGIAPQPVGRAPVRRALLTLPGGDATSAFVALNVADRVWRVVRCWRGSTVIELTEPPGIRLVGFQPSKREVGLLVLEPDQRTFSVVGRSASRVLHVHETGPVGTMALAQSGQAFAYLAGGELHVISSGGRRLLRERGNPP